MDVRTLILIVTLLAAALSGCISAKDEVGTENADAAPAEGDASDDADASVEPTPLPVAEIYQYSWVGQRALDQRFRVDEGYDHLVATFSHTGQMVGHPVLEDGDGEDVDDTFTSLTGGTFHLARVLPPTVGEWGLTMSAGPAVDGYVAGVGGFTVQGFAGHVPDELIHLTWTGQRTDPAILDSEIQFYVPPSVERFGLDLSGTGQTTHGFRLLDPDGEDMFTYGASSGPVSDTAEFDGKEGLWTVILEGSTNGPWTFRATTVEPAPSSTSDDWP